MNVKKYKKVYGIKQFEFFLYLFFFNFHETNIIKVYIFFFFGSIVVIDSTVIVVKNQIFIFKYL